MRRTILAGLAILGLAGRVDGSPAPATLADEISVEIVNVDVHAVGADGVRIEDLSRQAFRVFEDGQPVEITNFAWVPVAASRARPAGGAGASDPTTASEPRDIALFFDEIQIGEHARKPLIDALRQRLATTLAPGDRVSVVRFDGADLETLLPASTDRKKLDRALADLEGFSIHRLTQSSELRSYLDWIRSDIYNTLGKEAGTACANVGQMAHVYADVVRRNVEASGSALLRFAQRLSHAPGRRIVFHVSDGIPLVAGGEVFELAIEMCSGKAVAEGVPQSTSTSAIDPSGEFQSDRFNPRAGAIEAQSYQMGSFWTDIAARINALGITIYPVQAAEAGGRFLPDVDGEIFPASVRAMAANNPVDTLALLARETGGVLVRAGRGVDAEIDRLFADLDGYYSLAFRPSPNARPGLREIRVEVERPGVALRYRQSYRPVGRDERIVGQLVELFEADRVDNPLGLRVGVHRPEKSAERRLQVVVPFDRLTMVAGDGGAEGRFTVYLRLRDAAGKARPVRQRSIEAKRSDPKAVAYTYEIELPDDSADVAVGVFDEYAGTVAFVRQRVR